MLCIRNILFGMGSCVEKLVEVVIVIVMLFENFFFVFYYRFICEGFLLGNIIYWFFFLNYFKDNFNCW